MLSSPASSSSLFASLPARPPTPPRDVSKDVDDAFRFLEEGHHDNSITQTKSARVLDSPDVPPKRSPGSIQAPTSSAEKRVDFSPFPIVHNLSQTGHLRSPAQRVQKQSLLGQKTKPLKSILKASNDRLPLTPDDLEKKLSYFSPQEPGSFRKMLHSVLAQLASQSRDDRMDAYLAVNGAMKHYEGVPDPEALCEKMPLIQQFISRDLTWKDLKGRLDFSIAGQALQLTVAVLHNPESESTLDDDFRNLLIERSMTVIEQSDIPKGIYKLHMYLLSQQRFKSHILTPSRADKLLTILQGSEKRCSGNSIISSRLLVYSRLLKQAPSVMLTRIRDWIEYVFHGMLSSIPDIRIRAIEACVQAGLILGEQAQAAKIMYEIAEKEEEESQTYGDYLNARLKEMSANKEMAKWVPQIWAAIILLFRSKRRPVEKWPCFKDWLATIQRSLNSADTDVKHHANIAWNKLVFTVMPGSGTTESMKSMLRIPIMAGLEKRGNDRLSQQHRQIAMDSYCNLLHYGMRPGMTHEELDQAWDFYVEPILTKMAQGSAKSQHNVCCVLQGLLKKGTGVWNKNAANEPGAIKPEDLPRLEPRWVRSRLTRLIKILEPVILSGMWIMPDANAAANTCWRLLLEAVAEAGSQEVKASNELKEAMALLTNFFRRAWNGDWKSRNEVEGHVWLDRFHVLLEIAINCLGPVHFIEDVLSKTGENDLEAAPTPSHRTAKHSVVAYPAFVFLFALYYQAPSPLRTSGLYKTSAVTFMRLLVSAKGSVTGILALLHRVLQFSAPTAEQSDVAGQLWNIVAHEAVQTLQVDKTATPQRDAQVMGNALRSAINILLHGLRHAESSPGCLERAVELYGAACCSAKHHANDGGVVLGVMEPFTKSIIELLDDLPVNTVASIAQQVLQKGVWPKSRHELDLSRKVLWTVSLELPRTPVFDPFNHVYGLLNGLLARSYENLTEIDNWTSQVLCDLMKAMVDFLRRCPLPTLAVALRKTQAGVVHWIEDRRRVLFPLIMDFSNEDRFNIIETTSTCLIDTWSALTTYLERLPNKDSALLLSLEPLLIAGFSSPSRDIVNRTIAVWNKTFGQSPTLEYSCRILPVLRARCSEVDLDLPGFLDFDENAEIADLPAFAESQQNASDEQDLTDFTSSALARPLFRHLQKVSTENVPAKQHIHPEDLSAPSIKGRSSTSSTPRARLAHDNSQIDFAPIDSKIPGPTDLVDSQLLTEHQKEVKNRQRGDAQMFPELSSSPMAHTDSATRSIAKKLDFASSSGQEQEMVVATPSGLVDANPMSDDLPSSPTPRSNAVLRADETTTQYNEEDEETICDPPSSPPRAEGHAQRLLFDTGEADTGTETTATASDASNRDDQHTTATSDLLPSDTELPTVQLEREAAAANAEIDVAETTARDEAITPIEWRLPEIIDATKNQSQRTTINETQASGPRRISRSSSKTPSRVKNSMLETDEAQNSTPASTETGVETSTPRTRGQRKRKRRNEIASATKTAKKRAKSSPFRPWDGLRASKQDDEDDIEDEIVVASRHQRTSPGTADKNGVPSLPLAESQAESQSEPVNTIEEVDKQIAPEVPVKRKRGRPRKPGPQTPGQAGSSATKALKRSASVLSTASSQEQPTTSVVSETPAIPRARKSARLTQEAVDVSSSPGKVVLSVLQSPPPLKRAPEQIEVDAADEDAREEHGSVVLSPGQQLSREESAAALGRRIAQPRGLLSRLRGVLEDCKKMVFGSPEEEREFDDVLFEIRREAHEAGRRLRRQ